MEKLTNIKEKYLSNIYIYIYKLGFLPLILAFIGVALSGVFISHGKVFADDLNYQVNISDDIVLELSIPSSPITLDLTPRGNDPSFSSSNVTVSVGTNNPTGYSLSMKASNTSLTRTTALSDNTTPTISGLATLAGGYTESTFTTNAWGYKLNDSTNNCTNNTHGTNTTNYFNLTTTGDEILCNSNPTNKDTRTLALASKVDTSTPAGTYTANIVFTAVTNRLPYLQDQTQATLATMMPSTGDSTTLYDERDNQKYTVAHLADGNYWMTKNLNLAGGTVIESTMSNVPSGWTLDTAQGFQSGNKLPASSTTGFSNDATAYVYNSGKNSGTDCSSPGCYSYYSWIAATAGGKDASGNAVTSDGYNAAYSICPKGWKLPTATTSNAQADIDNNWKTGDFYALATAYGANLESDYFDDSSETGGDFYINAGPNTTPNFQLTGRYYSVSFADGDNGAFYWSSTSYISSYAYNFFFDSSYVDSPQFHRHRYGLGIRCLAKQNDYTIVYNAGTGGSGTMVNQVIEGGQTASLSTNTFTRTDYDFDGWLGSDGNTYTDGQSITAPVAGGTLTLTAQWKVSKIYMQDLTLANCIQNVGTNGNPSNVGDEITVYDRRDESDYTVRYINGACWMTQNLRITGTISSTYSNFTRVSSFNTKAADLKGSSQSYTQAQSHVADSTDVSSSSSASGGPYTTKQLGAWYNYCAASAGQVCSNSSTTNATQDICPANWHLPPTGSSAGQLSSITSYVSSFNPIYGGIWSNGSLISATIGGGWWSATANNSGDQYRMGFSSGSLRTFGNGKFFGFYIRCVRTS